MTTEHEDPQYQELVTAAATIGVHLSARQLDEVKTFVEAVIEYSSHTNIVGKAETSVLLRDHVLDSLTLIPHLRRSHAKGGHGKLVDIGSGGGFPGIVLSIAMPEAKATLIESAGKKVHFLKEVVKELGLNDRVSVIAGRAEDLGHDLAYRGRYEWGTARAVGTFDLSAELILPFLTVGGKFFAQKSANQREDEIRRAETCLPILGGQLSDVVDLDESLSGKSRIVLIAEKKSITPTPYARAFTKMKSKPLVTQ